jgi:hypothetical protein
MTERIFALTLLLIGIIWIKRLDGVLGPVITTAVRRIAAISTQEPCSNWYGCKNGYCWAGCVGAFASVNGPEWCYVTTGRKSDSWATCSSDYDCERHRCHSCGGACAAF